MAWTIKISNAYFPRVNFWKCIFRKCISRKRFFWKWFCKSVFSGSVFSERWWWWWYSVPLLWLHEGSNSTFGNKANLLAPKNHWEEICWRIKTNVVLDQMDHGQFEKNLFLKYNQTMLLLSYENTQFLHRDGKSLKNCTDEYFSPKKHNFTI